MRINKKLKNLLLIFSTILLIAFFIIEEIHDCSGEGCYICLAFSIIYTVCNILLALTLIPIVVEKVALIIKTYFFRQIESKENEVEESSFVFNNPINIIKTDLVSAGVRIN